MDDGQFDTMTRTVSTLLSRRTLAGALGLRGLGPASLVDARKKRKRKKKKCKKTCGPCRKCKKGKCKPKAAGTACGAGKQCFANGACRACDVCRGDCDFTFLQDAVTAASDGATIQLCPGTYPTNVTIDKDVTIIGAGAGTGGTVLDGQGLHRVLLMELLAQVELRDLRITGGFGTHAGIEYRGPALTLTSVAIVGNTSQVSGGGIYLDSNSTATLTDCEISGNTAGFGGGIYFVGDSTVTLTGCEISDNTAEFNGGGLSMNGDSAVTLTGCEISGNGSSSGGGIAINGDDSTVTLTGCEISGNTADFGGGMYNAGDATTLSDSHVTGNTATSQGGGIYNNNGTVLVIDGSSVTDNDPDDCAGTPAC